MLWWSLQLYILTIVYISILWLRFVNLLFNSWLHGWLIDWLIEHGCCVPACLSTLCVNTDYRCPEWHPSKRPENTSIVWTDPYTCQQQGRFFTAELPVSGPINGSAVSFLSGLGRRIADRLGETREGSFLFQWLSVLIQRFNTVLLYDCFADGVAGHSSQFCSFLWSI